MPTWDELLKETEEYQPLALFDKYVPKSAIDFLEKGIFDKKMSGN